MKLKGKVRFYYSQSISSLYNQEEIIYDEPVTTVNKVEKCITDMIKTFEKTHKGFKSYRSYGAGERRLGMGNHYEKNKNIEILNSTMDDFALMQYLYSFIEDNKEELFKGFKVTDFNLSETMNADMRDFIKRRDFEIHNCIDNDNIPPYQFTIRDYIIDKIADLISPTHYLSIDFGSHSYFIIVEFEDREDFYNFFHKPTFSKK